jgi:hypothetical protein
MDRLSEMAVGYEGFFEGRIKYFVARLRLIFVNQFVPPIDAREERFTIGRGEFGTDLHREYQGETLTITSGNFLVALQDQDAVDVRRVFHEKLKIPLAGANKFSILAEIHKRYSKPTLGLVENSEELVQFCFDKFFLHQLDEGTLQESGPEVKHLPVVQIVFPRLNLEPPESLSGAFEKGSAHGDSIVEKR